MHQGDTGASGGLAAGHGPLLPADVDELLTRSGGALGESPGDLRALRDDLDLALAALGVAGEILSADVALLRRCLARSGTSSATGDHDGALGLIEELPDVLAARPWGRGWSAPPHPRPGEDGAEDPEILTRSTPLWSSHHAMAGVDLTSEADLSAVLARIEEQLVGLSTRRSAVEERLAAVRGAIVREWSRRVERSLETPA